MFSFHIQQTNEEDIDFLSVKTDVTHKRQSAASVKQL